MPTRAKLAALAISLPLLALVGVAGAQQPAGDTDTDYAARAMTAAPPEVAHNATIVRLMNGAVQTLKKGDNEYTCMVGNEGPMCMGQIAMEWVHAWQNRTLPPNALGFIYMLDGDTGMSTTDPWATKSAPGNHWVKTGPHVMMVGLPVKRMTFPRTPDPDLTKPHVVWSGTPYEHVVLPLTRNSP
jgi:hypothetical protein